MAEAYRARAESFQEANGGKSATSLSDDVSVVRPDAEQDAPLLDAIENALTAANTANGQIDASFNTARGSEVGLGNDRTIAKDDAVVTLTRTSNQAATEATKAATQASLAISDIILAK